MQNPVLRLIRIPIKMPALARWAADRGWVQRHGFDEGRALHHLLSETFGTAVVQPFRLLVPPRTTVGNLYAYATASVEVLRETAQAIALPESLAVLALAELGEKLMPATWTTGQRLGFDLQTRPVRRLNSDILSVRNGSKFAKGAEIDAFLSHVLRADPDATPADNAATREAVYLDWLAERLAGAAELHLSSTRMVRFQRSRVARGDAGPEGPEAVFHGTFAIADPAQFATLLAHGVGRHRAYGYGMLLLRAPNQPIPDR